MYLVRPFEHETYLVIGARLGRTCSGLTSFGAPVTFAGTSKAFLITSNRCVWRSAGAGHCLIGLQLLGLLPYGMQDDKCISSPPESRLYIHSRAMSSTSDDAVDVSFVCIIFFPHRSRSLRLSITRTRPSFPNAVTGLPLSEIYNRTQSLMTFSRASSTGVSI